MNIIMPEEVNDFFEIHKNDKPSVVKYYIGDKKKTYYSHEYKKLLYGDKYKKTAEEKKEFLAYQKERRKKIIACPNCGRDFQADWLKNHMKTKICKKNSLNN